MQKIIYIIYCPPGWIKTPPLSLLYLKSYLRNKNIIVRLLDLNILFFKLFSFPKKEWLILNKKFEQNLFSMVEKNFNSFFSAITEYLENADYIGISLTNRNLNFSFSLAEKIKQKNPNKTIIFGGPQTLFLEKQNKLNPQYIWVIGEGEVPLCKIIKGIQNNIYCFEEIDDLDKIPFVSFDTLPLNLYSSYIPILTSRGCPYNCNFCSERKLYKKFRQHSPEYVFNLIKYLVSKYNCNNFIFCDSLINASNEWLEEFCSLIIKNNINIKWEAQARITKVTFDLARLIKKSGCFNLFIGLESGSDKILNYMNKGFDTKIAVDFLEKLYKAGLHFEISLIFGYPNEEEKDFKDTIKFISLNKKIIPKIAQVNPFIDYMDEFKNKNLIDEVKKRICFFIKFLEKEKIRYTQAFINNLLY